MSKFTLETVYKVWNDEDGDRIELAPDPDFGAQVEIRYVGPDNKITQRIMFPPDQALLVAEAIVKLATELKNRVV